MSSDKFSKYSTIRERRLSGGGLTDGRLDRAHKCDSCSNVHRTFGTIAKWATSVLCSFVVSSGILEIMA